METLQQLNLVGLMSSMTGLREIALYLSVGLACFYSLALILLWVDGSPEQRSLPVGNRTGWHPRTLKALIFLPLLLALLLTLWATPSSFYGDQKLKAASSGGASLEGFGLLSLSTEPSRLLASCSVNLKSLVS